MNSSAAIKRTLPILVIILIIIAVAISCSVFSKEKPIPKIPEEEGIYLSINEEERTYQITNQKIYNLLKKRAGLNVLIDTVDKDILSGVFGDFNYWKLVSEEDINEALEKAIFPDGKDDLSEEEIEEAETQYYENMYTGSGLRTKDEVKDYHRLILAKRLFAEDRLKDAIRMANEAAEEDNTLKPYFTEDDYETHYKANYEKKYGFWTIIIPFSTKEEAINALKQLGYEIQAKDPDNDKDFDKWVKAVNDEKVALTPEEVIVAFIDMYNTINSHKVVGYPENTLTLIANKHYTITEKDDAVTIEFNTIKSEEDETLNELYYSYEKISNYQAELQRYLSTTMKVYKPDTEKVEKDQNWFTVNPRSYNNNALHCYVLKIAEEKAPELEDVKDEIYKALFEAELTDEYIATEMVKLRTRKGLVIYDPVIEKGYIDLAQSYKEKIKPTKAKSETMVAKVGNVDYSTKQLFDLMDKRYGITFAISEINNLRLLNSPSFNKIFDYYLTEAKTSKRILNPQKWQSVKERAIREKQLFISGAYSQYGYGPQFGWKKFIREIYGVNNDEELLYHFLYSQVMTDYSNSLGDVSEIAEDSELWKAIEAKMGKTADDYFKVTGIHLLIKVEDENGNPINPDEWTDLQNDYAKQLYQQVWKYYQEETGTSQEKFEAIANAFTKSLRFVAKYDQTVTAQPELEDLKYVLKDIEVAKFKTAGLSVKYESLGEFTNGKMVKPFEEAVRSIWKANPSSQTHTPYASVPNDLGEWTYLVTEFGYHAYVNTSTIDIPKWDNEKGYVIPTLSMIKTNLKDSSSKFVLDEEGNDTDVKFTDEMKTAITTYFNPIKTELTGTDYTSIQLYEQIKSEDFGIIFNNTNYTKEEFVKFLEYRIKALNSKLKYFGTDEE
ncbi:MAG: hypothetical protein M0R05_01580 [Bacilli bacterium]|nr:hypothetical protein [Bacilli bacterium]MDD4076496.1 hypothetical protein [Bacilli bacterium]MDD4387624.1 hypothetical protein [Bacilli bacterium]